MKKEFLYFIAISFTIIISSIVILSYSNQVIEANNKNMDFILIDSNPFDHTFFNRIKDLRTGCEYINSSNDSPWILVERSCNVN